MISDKFICFSENEFQNAVSHEEDLVTDRKNFEQRKSILLAQLRILEKEEAMFHENDMEQEV